MAYAVEIITMEQKEELVDKYAGQVLYEIKSEIYGCCIKLLTGRSSVKNAWEESFYFASQNIRSHGRLYVLEDKTVGENQVRYDPHSKSCFLFNMDYYGWIKSLALSVAGDILEDNPDLGQEDIERINPFDWRAEYPEVFSRGGFDVVIGTPPYVRQESLGEFKGYFQKHFKVYQGPADLYAYFIERGVSLLQGRGIFSYIVANKWMRANYGLALRRWLREQCIEEIIDFGDLPVFLGATTYPCIIRIVRRPPQSSFQATQVKTLNFNALGEYVNENGYKVNQLTLDDSGWSLADEKTQALLGKINSRAYF